MKWMNEAPTEDGPHWLVEKRYEDGKLIEIRGPDIVEITVEEFDIETMSIGDECPSEFSKEMIEEHVSPKEPIFSFNDQTTALKKSKNLVTRKSIYYICPIEEPDINELID